MSIQSPLARLRYVVVFHHILIAFPVVHHYLRPVVSVSGCSIGMTSMLSDHYPWLFRINVAAHCTVGNGDVRTPSTWPVDARASWRMWAASVSHSVGVRWRYVATSSTWHPTVIGLQWQIEGHECDPNTSLGTLSACLRPLQNQHKKSV